MTSRGKIIDWLSLIIFDGRTIWTRYYGRFIVSNLFISGTTLDHLNFLSWKTKKKKRKINLLKAMGDRDGGREIVKGIFAISTPWWWCWWWSWAGGFSGVSWYNVMVKNIFHSLTTDNLLMSNPQKHIKLQVNFIVFYHLTWLYHP